MMPADKAIKIVICGGDGTFMRVILDMMKAGIDVNKNLHVRKQYFDLIVLDMFASFWDRK